MSPPSTLRRAMSPRGDATVVCPRHRRLETEAPMWPVLVVVPEILGKRLFQVTTAEDEGPVQALSPHGPNEALRIGVATRRSHRGLDDLDSLRDEHRVEA